MTKTARSHEAKLFIPPWTGREACLVAAIEIDLERENYPMYILATRENNFLKHSLCKKSRGEQDLADEGREIQGPLPLWMILAASLKSKFVFYVLRDYLRQI